MHDLICRLSISSLHHRLVLPATQLHREQDNSAHSIAPGGHIERVLLLLQQGACQAVQ